MEEAARLFYVGMTRAKRRLELLSYASKEGEPVRLSRFVDDVRRLQPAAPRPAVETGAKAPPVVRANANAIRDPARLVVGAKVRHAVFGDGEIVLTLGDSMDIRFREETKRLSANICVQMGLLEPASPD